MVVTPRFDPALFADRGAVGLLVAGRGPTVSRRETLDLLRLGDLPSPECANHRPCPIEIWVAAPKPGQHHNVVRYEIAIVGGGYHGLLVSDRTRIPGLVFAGDVPDTVEDLTAGRSPPVRSRADPDAAATLARLDHDLSEAHDARDLATVVLVACTLLLLGLAVARRSALLARAAILAPPTALSTALALSGLDVRERSPVAAVLAMTTLAVPPLVAWRVRRPVAFGLVLLGFLAVFAIVLAAWPVTNALAAIGPHPDGGGRFYGVTNQVETLLLVPALLGGALVGRRLLPLAAALALVTVGWSKAGADGGGLLVLLVGYVVLWFRLGGKPLTRRRLALAGVAVVVGALALVALDAALGGSDHVTRSLSSGPSGLAGDLAHRAHVSWVGATGSWHAALIVAGGIAVLAVLATRRPRSPVLDALLAGLAVSLLVNDTPTDVAGFGALVATSVYVWERFARPPSQRSI